MERVIAASGGENLGRPHLARALVECGHAKTIKDAFDRFLHSRGPLWVDRRRLSVTEAVELVRKAGGTSSVAHPGANGISSQELKVCADAGLDAVEALHPDHVPTQSVFTKNEDNPHREHCFKCASMLAPVVSFMRLA